MNGKYVLDDQGNVRPEEDLLKWAEWFEHAQNRVLARDQIGDVLVSTIFLGLDHGLGRGLPVLWETVIFGGKHHQAMWRYTSWEEAMAGHFQAVNLVREEVPCLE